ncbi:MAG TPA: hypothetical protein VEB20_18515 [Azospirillaceae bacterium]|nr:hypothetical protein [Azospirillaceae bacterium]
MTSQAGIKQAVGLPAGPAGDGASGETTVTKLQAHFQTLDDPSLTRVARAVELARATAQGDPTDEQILQCLRPRLRDLRPNRVRTFQRSVCTCLEPYLANLEPGTEKRRGLIARSALTPWWRLLTQSAYRPRLVALEQKYCKAVSSGQAEEAADATAEGCALAAEATADILHEADRGIVRKGEVAVLMGGERGLADLREISVLMRLQPLLGPVFTKVRAAAPALSDGRVADFAPGAVIAAKNAYLNMHGDDPEAIEYFFLGLMSVLSQPWQVLRLVRVLSGDMSKAGSGDLHFVPGRLFGELTRTLGEIGRSVGGTGSMSRRVWLMTCARLLTDAASMVQGLAEELQAQPNPEWEAMLTDARKRMSQAADHFATVAVRDAVKVLPTQQVKEKVGEARSIPDMNHRPTEEEVAVAQAAATLFTTCRRFFEREGLEKSLRAKESDMLQIFENGVHFRVEFLRARGKHPVALLQLDGVHKVLRGMVQTDEVRDMIYKVERAIERFK